MRSITAAVLLLGLASAQFENNVPIPGRRPQFVVGEAKQGIDFQIVYDLMCSDSAALNPALQTFLQSTWNVTNTTVQDAVKISYTFLPLPYHHEVWISHKLVPYFLDTCQFGPGKCQMLEYMTYCLENQDSILDSKNVSENALIKSWTLQVSAALNIPQADLLQVYGNSDTHDSEWRTREMYKYNTASHSSGTPFGYVNGILLENFPASVDEWTQVLFSVYES